MHVRSIIQFNMKRENWMRNQLKVFESSLEKEKGIMYYVIIEKQSKQFSANDNRK